MMPSLRPDFSRSCPVAYRLTDSSVFPGPNTGWQKTVSVALPVLVTCSTLISAILRKSTKNIAGLLALVSCSPAMG